MPLDRFFHPRAGHSAKVCGLTDFEFRVWWTYQMAADDYGVMRASATTIKAANDAFEDRKTIQIERALKRLIEVGLLTSFEHQRRVYVCQLDWQDFQKIRYPRESHEPTPCAEVLAKCSDATVKLFALHSGKVSGTKQEQIGEHSETKQSLPRAPAREEANGLRLEANGLGKRPVSKSGSGVMAGSLPRDHANHIHCGRKCVPAFLHAEFKQGLGGDPDAAAMRLAGGGGDVGWYRKIEATLPEGPIGDEPVKFWRAQFAAAFQAAAKPTNGLPHADDLLAQMKDRLAKEAEQRGRMS